MLPLSGNNQGRTSIETIEAALLGPWTAAAPSNPTRNGSGQLAPDPFAIGYSPKL